ncbi:MAG: patatin family protein [Caldilineaceae bacterium]|nr:patatin family protein [Caldilineaceae bacterium]
MQAIDNRHPQLRGFRAGDVFRTSLGDVTRQFSKLPRAMFNVGRSMAKRWTELALSDVLWEVAETLPAGLYNSSSLECYVRDMLEQEPRTNQFNELAQELYIVATELDSGKRAVFGPGDGVTISQAVAASSAVPILYRPVRVGDSDYVDGGLHGAASLDLAIEAGAKLVVCVNPMAPLDASRTHAGEQFIRKHGLQAVINQSVRTLMHSTIRYHIKNLRAKYPDVDIILIQPHWGDYRMFSFNPMHYCNRLTVAEHGFESVTVGLTENFDYFDNVLSRHNIRFTKNLVVEELDEIRSSGEDPDVVERILARPEPGPTLASSLDHLEWSLRRLDATVSAD